MAMEESEVRRTEVIKRTLILHPIISPNSLVVPQKFPFFPPSLCALNPIKAPHLLRGEEPNPTALLGPAPSCSSTPQIPKHFFQNIPNL